MLNSEDIKKSWIDKSLSLFGTRSLMTIETIVCGIWVARC